jgi:UDP-glucose 4-epimerase
MIVVFGAKGFIGTYLCDRLKQDGIPYWATDIDEVDITKQKDFDNLPQKDVDLVIHLACLQPANVSEREYNPRNYISTNVIGTLNILDYCVGHNAKLIYFNSRKPVKGEYGLYAISERTATECVKYYNKNHALKYIIFRLPPVYGYGCFTEIFQEGKPIKTGFQTFIDNAIQGKPIEVWGNAKVGRPIAYVKDVVNAIMYALKSGNEGLYDLWTCKSLTLKQEVEAIIEVFANGHKPKIIYQPDKQNSIEQVYGLWDYSWLDTGWRPIYNFHEMLVDYKKEWESGRFKCLVQKRKELFDEYYKNIVL